MHEQLPRQRWRRFLVWSGLVAILLLAIVGGRDDGQRLQITVERGYRTDPPRTIRLRIRVEPDAANRGLNVSLFSEQFESSSWEDLPGAEARITRWIPYYHLPSGAYDVVAEVVRPGAASWFASDRFFVGGI